MAKLLVIEGKVESLMATTAEALAVLGQINADTNEIADAIAALAARPDVGPEVTDALNAAATHLRGVASAFDPVVVTPDVIPGSEPLPADVPPTEPVV